MPVLDADLRVRRLARLDLDAGPRRGHAGVPEAEALRVPHDGADAVTQVAQVAGGRRIARAQRVVADAGILLALRPQDHELRRRVARRRPDVREGLDEADPDDERGGGEHDREGSAAARRRARRARARARGTRPACASRGGRRRRRRRPRPSSRVRLRATRKSRTITSTYAVASGLRNVETSRRIGLSSSPVL